MEVVVSKQLDYINRIKTLIRAEQANKQEVKTNFRTVAAYVKGRMFDRWVDSVSGSARSNDYNENDLIDRPSYLIESLLRDENFTERDLRITTINTPTCTLVVCNGLKSDVDDYYNNAIYYNATSNHKTYITDYSGGAKAFLLADADLAGTNGDNIFLQNIQGDLKIDYASFDAIGNTTNGTRKDWIFARSFTEKQNIRDILDELCFESHCELIESVGPDTGLNLFKLIAIDIASGDTWTNPAYSGGIEQITAGLTPLENVFTQFRLRYFFDYGKGDFIKEMYVDKNGFPSTATILSATEQNLCIAAETNYNVQRLFEYSSRNIYDDATAEMFLQKKIEWFTKQRLLVNYLTPIIGNSDWIKYEVGDQVKLNFSQGIPDGLNNSAMFMITNKSIKPSLGGGVINWNLIEIGVLPS
jgi:hypothetical protein